ncbi:MAG: AMP-binding protein [Acidobacteriota bacterium]|nr:AMP-binding protein [Acidobacteriota bacterium]
MSTNIFAEIEQTARQYPDNLALEMFGDDADTRYSYRQVMEFAAQLGQALRQRGVGKGDRVAFWARLTPNWVVAYLGVMQIGAVIVPLDFEYSSGDLASILDRTQSKFIFSVEEKLAAIKNVAATLATPPTVVLLDAAQSNEDSLSINELFQQSLPVEALPEIAPNDVGMIFFTSGTTGKSKGVVIEHRSITNTMHGLLEYIRVSSSDKALAVIPSHHIFATLANVLMPLLKGGSATYLRALNSVELMRTMTKAKVTVFPAVPQVFYLLHKKIFDEVQSKPLSVRIVFKLLLGFCRTIRQTTGLNPGPKVFAKVHQVFGGQLRLLVSAGSYFDPRVIRDLYSLGFTVQQGYALTETFGAGTFTPFDDNIIGSAGKPLPGTEIKLMGKDELGVGEIAIYGDSVMRGYLNDAEATGEVLRDGWFYTGDLATQDNAGNIFIKGRRKEMIVLSSGKNIYPEEVELHYQQIPYVKEMCVLGLAGDNGYSGSERLHAIIVPDFDYLRQQRIVNSKEVIRESIEEYSASLPKYKRVLSYELRTEPLPRTASKKIQRFLVAEQLANAQPDAGGSSFSAYVPVEGDDLLQAMESSRQVLEVLRRESQFDGELHLDMNLELDLGFDSLQRIEVLMQIEQLLNIHLGDEVASQTFTVRELLKTVAQKLEDGQQSKGINVDRAPVTWKEIIAAADTDDMAAKYILQPTAFSRIVHFLFLRFIFLLGKILFRLKVRGLENLPQQRPFLICPNHQGYVDGPLMSSVLPYRVLRYMFTLGFTPFFTGGFKDVIARMGRIVPVDPDTNLGRAMRISAIGLKAKQNLLIFPEGSLTCDGELQVFKKGVAILARELQIPIVPAAIEGSFAAWSKVGDKIRLKPISITFGQPLMPPSTDKDSELTREQLDQEYARFTQQIRDSISNLLEEVRRGQR